MALWTLRRPHLGLDIFLHTLLRVGASHLPTGRRFGLLALRLVSSTPILSRIEQEAPGNKAAAASGPPDG